MLIEDLMFMKKLQSRESRFYHTILDVYESVKSLLNQRISQVFPTYTQHDIEHSIRIIKHMEKIIPDVELLNDLEITLLILSALLHDIGMAATDEEKNEIIEEKKSYNDVKYSALLNKFNGNEMEAIQEYFRKVHADRSDEYINMYLEDKLVIHNMQSASYASILGLICKAHTQDILWIKNNLSREDVIGYYEINLQFCAMVLRLADILDFDSSRTPYKLYNAINLGSHSNQEWQQHFAVKNTNKVFEEDGKKYIKLYGHCSDPIIHRKVLNYIDWINEEIINAIELTGEFKFQYRLQFYHRVINNIESKEYSIVDMKFQMDYKKTLNLLMGQALYGDKKAGLRELVQNSIDACMVLQEVKEREEDTPLEEYKPKIHIVIDEKKGIVTIKDNGIGMNEYTLKKYFLDVGASYFKSDDYLLKGFNYIPIGSYGIGFLACFMLSQNVKIKTRHHLDVEVFEVEIFKDSEFVAIKKEMNPTFQGTEVILDYNSFNDVFNNMDELSSYLSSTFLMEDFEIIIVNPESDNRKINLENDLSGGASNTIQISKYLEDIDCRLTLAKKNQKLTVEYFNEIIRKSIDFFYDGSELIDSKKSNEIKIKDYINDKFMVNIISFMHISNSIDLDMIKDILDDEDQIEDLYKEQHTPFDIEIAVSSNVKFEEYNGLVEEDEIALGLNFDKLNEMSLYSHDNNSGTFFEYSTRRFFGVDDVDKFFQLGYSKSFEAEIYIRNVYVDTKGLTFSNHLLDLNVGYLRLNIKNKEIKPNVSRDKLDSSSINKLKNSIVQAIYLFVLENSKEGIERLLLKEYIYQYHNYEETYLKLEYQEKIRSFGI